MSEILKNRAFMAFVILNLSLAFIFLMPRNPKMKSSAIIMKLPKNLGLWQANFEQVHEREKQILGHDTSFERASYQRPHINMSSFFEVDIIRCSIVLSGHEMNRSIHRAERCLRSQGFTIENQKKVYLKINDIILPLKRVLSYRILEAGYKYESIMYYWFVGHDFITNDHLTRTIRDMRDRLLFGYDQQWGYISVTINIPPHKTQSQLYKPAYSLVQAEEIARQFISKIYKKIHKTAQIKTPKKFKNLLF